MNLTLYSNYLNMYSDDLAAAAASAAAAAAAAYQRGALLRQVPSKGEEQVWRERWGGVRLGLVQ